MSKGGGSAPQPVNPYTQAGAQYDLSTGTAEFNAGLNRTNNVNPLGSSQWNITGYTGEPSQAPSGIPPAYNRVGSGEDSRFQPAPGVSMGSPYGFGGDISNVNAGSNPYNAANTAASMNGSGAPIYTQTTSLAPWANQELSQPLDTSQIPGMPGGPSLEQNVSGAQRAAFNQQMGLLAPQEEHQIENTQANLAAQGATPGSPAYNWGMEGLGLMLGPENAQVANQSYLTGINTLPTLYGLGSESLQNQIAARNAPINEFEALLGGPGANATAMTPDISNAFNQQYQGQLAAYNANNAANNQTWSDVGQLAGDALMYFALA